MNKFLPVLLLLISQVKGDSQLAHIKFDYLTVKGGLPSAHCLPATDIYFLKQDEQGGGFSTVVLYSTGDDGNNFSYQTLAPHIPIMIVEGKSYTDANITTSSIEGATQSYYHWAKGAGLIKRVETIGTATNTYSLLSGK